MSDPIHLRTSGRVLKYALGSTGVQRASDVEDHGSVTAPAALSRNELLAMLHQSPATDGATSALNPYLRNTELSDEAYDEWLVRVCEQPNDD